MRQLQDRTKKSEDMENQNWRQNALTERLGVDLPLFLSPMGRLSTPELASAVANAGGVGGMGMAGVDPAKLRERILEFRDLSDGALNINFLLFQPDSEVEAKSAPMRNALSSVFANLGLEMPSNASSLASDIAAHQIETLVDTKPEVISFHFGLPPDHVMDKLRDSGAFLISTATTLAEACELERRGIDAVIVQGTEAGGHRGTFSGADVASQSGLFSLLPQVVDKVSVPVIAAGGIADGRGIAAALTLGASAVQMGTAFLLCPESGSSDFYRQAIGDANEGETLITERASGRPARIVKNKFVDKIAEIKAPTAPFPTQASFVGSLATSDKDWQAVYAGQSASVSRPIAAEKLLALLIQETDNAFSQFS